MNGHRVAWSTRGHLIYLLALPLLPTLLAVIERGDWLRTAVAGTTLGLFVLAALAVRVGTRRQRREAFSRYGRSSTHVLTWLGCVAVSAGCFASDYVLGGRGLSSAGMLAIAGFAGAYLSYGSLWARVRPTAGMGYSAEEIAGELQKAERLVQGLEAAARELPHGEMRRRLKRIAVKTYRVLFAIERDPADLRRARRFLNVFLPGAVSIAESYVKADRHGPTDEFDTRFADIHTRTEAVIDAQQSALRDRHAFDLDVQMDVLKTQLEAEARRG